MTFLFKFHKTPLTLAIEKGNKEILEILLQHPVIDVNVKLMVKKTKDDIQKKKLF